MSKVGSHADLPVAWRHGATLLARDVEMNRIAEVVGIELEDASLFP